MLFSYVVDWMADRARDYRAELVAGVDARGFLFAGAVAHSLGLPLVPIRKAGKLPYRTLSASYTLEYGTSTIEVHEDAVNGAKNALLIDDLVATGGTLVAATELLRKLGVETIHVVSVVDLPELGGSRRVAGKVDSLDFLVSFSEEE